MQHYVEVLVADQSYHGNGALTYRCMQQLTTGSIVTVPLRNKNVLGIVTRHVAKPAFAVKDISDISSLPALPAHLLQLLSWMRTYYPSPLGTIVQQFLPKQLAKKPAQPVTSPSFSPPNLPPLTTEQHQALSAIRGPGLHILHGETGSGKTRIYIELAKNCIAEGKSVIVLTPEISLIPQLAASFQQSFGEKVVVMHSQLTEAQRQRTWVDILQQKGPLIVVGTRSALFVPLRAVGLIVIDESHEAAYKQEQTPYYHATRVASKLAQLQQSVMILGSATPSLTDYYIAKAKQRPVLRMQQTATSSDTPLEKTIHVVDLRDRTKFTKSPYLSDELIASAAEALKQHAQILLFLNRRGTARIVFCDACGWQATCPHCDLPLVYHGDSHRVRCHTCTYSSAVPSGCPQCRNTSVIFKSIGTKAIQDEISRLFPSAKIQRFDTDNNKAERLEHHYQTVKEGGVDIIVGTQTLAKGLDLPKLSLVGVIIADTSLSFPDFTAQERTYQLLSQVLGRVGRGHRAGKAIIQTYAPDSPLVEAVLTKNWEEFYQKELAERRQFLFPPYCHLLKLTCRRASRASAQSTSKKLVNQLFLLKLPIIIEGPAPAFHEKIQNKYQWQIVVKSKRREALLSVVSQLPAGWSYNIDPTNLL
ncbi:MAG TPA: primosomal protein N' [Nevskiaceae bacterium]|nr:primosomal protein N' [Nevskiaceae bacterium]